MKNTLLSLFITAAVATTASAQTIWNGSVNSNLTTAGNWDNGVPSSSGNPGTINTGATVTLDVATTTGYFVTQTGGAVAGPADSTRGLNGGNWTISGGTFTVNGVPGTNGAMTLQSGSNGNQIFNVSNTGQVSIASTATVGGGTTARTATLNISGGNFTTRNLIVADGGSALNISGGNFTATNASNASGIRVNGTASLNISGGNVSSNQELRSSSSNLLFTGGTSSFVRINADAGFGLTLGGTTAGSLTAGKLGTSLVDSDTNFKVDWLTGSKMTFTLSLLPTWAPDFWANGKMTYNGQTGTTLGLTWAQVIDPLVGFNGGGGTYFDWDSGTRTLALVPEPSTWALLAVGMTAAVIFRRRRRA